MSDDRSYFHHAAVNGVAVDLHLPEPDPEEIARGDKVIVNGQYSTLSSEQPLTGKYRMYQNGEEVIVEEELEPEFEYAGTSELGISIEIPGHAETGMYEVEVELSHGESQDRRRTEFTVR